MITVNEQTKKLSDELNDFLKVSHNTLSDVLNGMTFARDLVNNNNEKENLSRVIDKISNVDEIMSSFKISIKDTNNKLCLFWDKTGSQEKYHYNEVNELTEKMFHFILMTFDREISQRLSIIEEANKGYIYFCNKIKNQLHNIITNYMIA